MANAILDGTDCIMLSGESAMGKYPEEAVAMLAKIAAYTEAHRAADSARQSCAAVSRRTQPADDGGRERSPRSWNTRSETVPCAAVFVPTRTGTTARMISRFKPAVWMVALSRGRRRLPGAGVLLRRASGRNSPRIRRTGATSRAAGCARSRAGRQDVAMLVAGPSAQHPDANHRIEFMRLAAPA